MDRALPGVRQSHQLAHPVAHHFLHLGKSGTALPGNTEGSEAGTGDIAQHRGQRCIGREPAEMHGMLDLGDARHHDGLEIPHHVGKRFRLFGRRDRQRAPDIPRPHPGPHRQVLDAPAVVADPVDEFVRLPPEFFRIHACIPWCSVCCAASPGNVRVPGTAAVSIFRLWTDGPFTGTGISWAYRTFRAAPGEKSRLMVAFPALRTNSCPGTGRERNQRCLE